MADVTCSCWPRTARRARRPGRCTLGRTGRRRPPCWPVAGWMSFRGTRGMCREAGGEPCAVPSAQIVPLHAEAAQGGGRSRQGAGMGWTVEAVRAPGLVHVRPGRARTARAPIRTVVSGDAEAASGRACPGRAHRVWVRARLAGVVARLRLVCVGRAGPAIHPILAVVTRLALAVREEGGRQRGGGVGGALLAGDPAVVAVEPGGAGCTAHAGVPLVSRKAETPRNIGGCGDAGGLRGAGGARLVPRGTLVRPCGARDADFGDIVVARRAHAVRIAGRPRRGNLVLDAGYAGVRAHGGLVRVGWAGHAEGPVSRRVALGALAAEGPGAAKGRGGHVRRAGSADITRVVDEVAHGARDRLHPSYPTPP
eukprot:266387-Hanusia_phi.AAC.1